MNTIETKTARLSVIQRDGIWCVEMQLRVPEDKASHFLRINVPFKGLVDLAEYIISKKESTYTSNFLEYGDEYYGINSQRGKARNLIRKQRKEKQ